MTDLMLDAHALVWQLEKWPNRSERVRVAIELAGEAGSRLDGSAESIAEILDLEEKGRLPGGAVRRVLDEMSRADSGIAEAAFVAAGVEAMSQIPRAIVPDRPGRMVAATAKQLGLAFVTDDHQIRAAGMATVW